MSYTKQYRYLKSIYSFKEEQISIEDSKIEIRNLPFNSVLPVMDTTNEKFVPDDKRINENTCFRYPVFLPSKNYVNNQVIILVHGLNEKTWTKYLSWAKKLCEDTGKSVILFPIAFHINRAPSEWSDPREMSKLLEIRKQEYPDVYNSTVINLALSNRLTKVPQRFFLSGYNYAYDIIQLMTMIRSGDHPYFKKDTQIDFFAYSIGVFMVQCLMLGGPQELFRNCKYVFFAGGSLFGYMNGISKYIMDSKAFDRIYYYYMNEMEADVSEGKRYAAVLKDTRMGMAFRSMMAPDRHTEFREKLLRDYRHRLLVLPLLDDKVMPLKNITELMWNGDKKNSNLKILNFDFPAIHENPFPVHLEGIDNLLDNAFLEVFDLAGEYFIT
jgi:hypothetical protein